MVAAAIVVTTTRDLKKANEEATLQNANAIGHNSVAAAASSLTRAGNSNA